MYFANTSETMCEYMYFANTSETMCEYMYFANTSETMCEYMYFANTSETMCEYMYFANTSEKKLGCTLMEKLCMKTKTNKNIKTSLDYPIIDLETRDHFFTYPHYP
jgi:hypothetical protein